MALSARARQSSLDKAQQILGPDGKVVAYAQGSTGPNPAMFNLALAGGIAAMVAISLAATGTAIIPGLLLIALAKYLVNGPRAIVAADKGVALLSRSIIDGRPANVIRKLSADQLVKLGESRGWVHVACGPDQVWLRTKEWGCIAIAHAATLAPTPRAVT